ncbi:ATPase, T2SS/T4P/T4SS family [Paeniroseomonas aquatica]|uniref:ATPase, T2SS/T4P/T4SS family n=1 Tax=Paeniroseomonas aquatica TaxID=373043 RepID=UPI00360794D7
MAPVNPEPMPSFGRRPAEARPGRPVPEAPGPAAPRPLPTPAAPLAELRALCLARIDPAAVANMATDRLAAEVERLLAEVATDQRLQLNAREQRQLALDLVDDMLGLGPLEPLLDDETITDIMVNGHDRVFVEQRGRVVASSVRFRDNQHLANIAQRIAAGIGRRIDESSPMVDARLTDGSRVNIIFPPLALDGPCLSIRKSRAGPSTSTGWSTSAP